MFLPDGSEYGLKLPGCSSDSNGRRSVKCVVGNRDRTLFAAVTSSIVYIYLSHPQLLLCALKRSEEDVKEKGEFRRAYWRFDSSAICFTTSENCLLIYRVDILPDKQSYNLVEPREEHLKRASQELFIRENRLQLNVYLSVVARLDSASTCIVPLRDELFVCLYDGWVHRLAWDGVVDTDFSFSISKISFAIDQLQTKTEFIDRPGLHVVDIAYAPLMGGFSMVLSDGTASLLTSPSSSFFPKELLAIWAGNLRDAVCTTTNHKYRLIVFGCRNGDISAFHLDDTNGSLVFAYRVSLQISDGPELLNRLGEVGHIECYVQGTAYAVVWANCQNNRSKNGIPIVALFSTFGSQLWCSLESASEREEMPKYSYNWVDWGPEGFCLWLASDHGLSILPLARSAWTGNSEGMDRMIFLSANRIYISAAKEKEQSVRAPQSIWHVLSVPANYLSLNWPPRLVEMDDEGKWLVVAGARGFVHHNLMTGKWRMFGNESQERDLLVTGGMTIWEDHVILACYDFVKNRDELRFYVLKNQLKNQFCSHYPTDSRTLLLSRRRNRVITFDTNSRILIYTVSLSETKKNGAFAVCIQKCAEIRVVDLVHHAACVLLAEAAYLNHESSATKFCKDIDTILLNVCGRLIMLNPMKRGDSNDSETDEEDSQASHFFVQLVAPALWVERVVMNRTLSPPILIASYVEHIWHNITEETESMIRKKPHLTQALWLSCGAKGMKVWMPLFSSRRDNVAGGFDSSRTFISKRIMLPFEVNISPIVICSGDCLAIGVESSPSNSNISNGGVSNPFYNLHRKSEVFLHHLLRQLLKRNLGVYALEIAATCIHLPYFGHVLELLLHNVLEEEATSSEPIPDPLLPGIVAFIQEFPNYLQTVAHCARKTELALWNSLFTVTGHPKELFEKCIRDGQLETAVSFLIILQNMESSAASQEHAIILLEECLDKRKWIIARDIVRFLRAIDPTDVDEPLHNKSRKGAANTAVTRVQTRLSTSDNDETDSFVFDSYSAPGVITRTRQQDSVSGTTFGRRESVGLSGKKLLKSGSHDLPPSPTGGLQNPTLFCSLDDLLKTHAAHLLEDCSIHDLGAFAAYLDFDLAIWLKKVKNSLAKVSDYGLALMRLHAQFSWPYPLVSQSIVDQLSKSIEGIQISQSCASLDSLQSLSTATSFTSFNVGVNGKRTELTVISNADCDENREADSEHGKSDLVSIDRQSTVSVPSGDNMSNSGSDWEGFEKICGEVASRGTQESELELKFMLDLMYEAECAEWTFLLCLLRRDTVFLTKYFTCNFLDRCGASIFAELRNGIDQLLNWAECSCFGYRTLIDAFKRHVSSLERQKENGIEKKHSQIKASGATSPTKINGNTNSNKKLRKSSNESAFNTGHKSIANGNVVVNDTNRDSLSSESAATKMVKKSFTPPHESEHKNAEGSNVVSSTPLVNDSNCSIM